MVTNIVQHISNGVYYFYKAMLDVSQMVTRLAVALVLGALMGLERELSGKEAGVRTSMLVAGGAAVFSIIALSLPHLVALSPQHLEEVLARNSGFFGVIANIVVGIGFLGAGIIIKQGEHVHGLTTAAVVWSVAGVGILVGIGLIKFAVIAAVIVSTLLYFLRCINLDKRIQRHAANYFPQEKERKS